MRDDGELVLTVGGRDWSGWKEVRVTRGIERIPGDFDLLVSDLGHANAGAIVPGQQCLVSIGGDTAQTGYVDRYQPSISARRHGVRVTGRGKCQDLVDCAAWLRDVRGQVNFSSVAGLMRQLAAPFGIGVKAPNGEGPSLPQFNIGLVERGWDIVDRIARYAGMLAYEDAAGDLVLANVGQQQHASGFVQGENVEAANVVFSADQRFSLYEAVAMSVDTLLDVARAGGGPLDYNLRAQARDLTVPRFRPLVFVSEQSQYGQNIAQRRADWELARRYGRSQAVHITCDSWRDDAGFLWEPNCLAPVHLPALHIVHQLWLVVEVTYRRGEDGTHADVVLMPPEAFTPEPTILQPYDWQVAEALASFGR